MTGDDFVTVPRKYLDHLSRRVAALEAQLAQLTGQPVEQDSLRVAFARFNERARRHEERRAVR